MDAVEKYPNLRTAIKVILFLLSFLLAGAVASIGTIILAIAYFIATGSTYSQAAQAAASSLSSPWFSIPYLVAQNVLFVLVALLLMAVIERRSHPIKELGLKPDNRTLKLFAAGVLLSATLAIATIAILLLFNVITFETTGASQYGIRTVAASFVAFLVATLFIGLGEEALFRGYLQRLLVTRYGVAAGLIVTSVIFALAHTITYNTPLPIMGVFMASLVMGYLYIITGSLWTSIGFHFIWDFLLLEVFQLGKPTIELGSYPLLIFSLPRQVVINGINLGGWDDLVSVIVLILGLVALYLYNRNRRARTQKSK